MSEPESPYTPNGNLTARQSISLQDMSSNGQSHATAHLSDPLLQQRQLRRSSSTSEDNDDDENSHHSNSEYQHHRYAAPTQPKHIGADDRTATTAALLHAHQPPPIAPSTSFAVVTNDIKSPSRHDFSSSSFDNSTNSTSSSTEFTLYRTRWWILFIFCFISFNQSWLWLGEASIADQAEKYYNISMAQIDLMLNWPSMTNIPILLFAIKVACTSRGLRLLVLSTACAGLLSAILRVMPEIFHSSLHPHAVYFLHASSIINAASGPAIQVTLTKISCKWFSARERPLATAILFISRNSGSALGFVLGPALVPEERLLPVYLWVQLVSVCIAFVCSMAYYPANPLSYPSSAAKTMAEQEQAAEAAANARTITNGNATYAEMPNGDGTSLNSTTSSSTTSYLSSSLHELLLFLRTFYQALHNRSFVLLALSSGLAQGIFGNWIGVLSTLLPYGDTTCGWFSFAASIAGCSAGMAMGALTRDRKYRRKLRKMMLTLTSISIVLSIWFLLNTESVFSMTPLIKSDVYVIGITITLLGAILGATYPLAYEFITELTFPLSESISGGMIQFVTNGAGFIFLFLAPSISAPSMNAIMSFVCVACTLLLIPISEQYKRTDAEDKDMEMEQERRRMMMEQTMDGKKEMRKEWNVECDKEDTSTTN